ncbi:sensor of ECF-type sigma factor [uncultured Wocania sp.]|uniref:sensor of ECF-type sigma factor n=1 Tax=uncultured Wocania sp. TaxID=2834404 RepID=UPI0030F837EC
MKTITLFIFTLFISFSILAQEKRGDKHEKIKALKIAFITEKLDLTEKEAQQFWPIYNLHDDNINQIRQKKLRKIHYEIRQNKDDLSENQAANLLNRLTTAENNIHKERLQLTTKLKSIISAKKIILLKVAEEEFKHKMLKQFKMRRQKEGKRN